MCDARAHLYPPDPRIVTSVAGPYHATPDSDGLVIDRSHLCALTSTIKHRFVHPRMESEAAPSTALLQCSEPVYLPAIVIFADTDCVFEIKHSYSSSSATNDDPEPLFLWKALQVRGLLPGTKFISPVCIVERFVHSTSRVRSTLMVFARQGGCYFPVTPHTRFINRNYQQTFHIQFKPYIMTPSLDLLPPPATLRPFYTQAGYALPPASSAATVDSSYSVRSSSTQELASEVAALLASPPYAMQFATSMAQASASFPVVAHVASMSAECAAVLGSLPGKSAVQVGRRRKGAAVSSSDAVSFHSGAIPFSEPANSASALVGVRGAMFT